MTSRHRKGLVEYPPRHTSKSQRDDEMFVQWKWKRNSRFGKKPVTKGGKTK